MTANIADSVFCAGMACAKDLPDIEYERKIHEKGKSYQEMKTEAAKRRPTLYEVEVYSFPQGWGSTALGFGGIGGQAMTEAQTTVILSRLSGAVYFGTGLAYVIQNYTTAFMTDIHSHAMAARGETAKYRKPEEEK